MESKHNHKKNSVDSESKKSTDAKQFKQKIARNSKRNESQNEENPTTKLALSIITIFVAFLAMCASFLAIYMSWRTNQVNAETTERYRLESEHYQRLELNRALEIKTNIEFWDYTIDLLIENLANRHGLTEQLWNVAALISSKQSGTALEFAEELEPELKNDGEFNLLKCCVILRNNITQQDYLDPDLVFDRELLVHSLENSLENNLDTTCYSISLGIIYYYLQDIVNSAKYLKYAIEMYDSDSPFFSVANYWLAMLSVNIDSCICDYNAFLESTFQENYILNLMKSAICFIKPDCSTSNTIDVTKSIGLDANPKYTHFELVNSSMNPAEFLKEDVALQNYSSPYYTYNMIYVYTDYFSFLSDYKICPYNDLDNQNVQLSDIAKSGYHSMSSSLYSILLNPKNTVGYKHTYVSANNITVAVDNVVSLVSWASFDLYSKYIITPYEIIMERCIYLSKLRETDNGANYDWIYTQLCDEASKYRRCSELAYNEMGRMATIAVKYSAYKSDDNSLDIYDAAKCAYLYGYRYDFIYRALTESCEQVGDQVELERLKSEMQILGYLH